MSSESEAGGRPRVVILGGGYGGVYTALGLQKAARKGRIELSLVSRDNFFLYQPMLAEVVSGSIEPPHILNPIRRLCPDVNFYQAEIEAIDMAGRQVVIRYPGHGEYQAIHYDHLVVAVGGTTDLTGIPGMAEHAFPFKTIGDALFLRNHLIGCLEGAEVEQDPDEKKELLTFVVAGGGYTGVEVAAEINDFTREAARSYRHVSSEEIRVVLLQGGSRILPVLHEGLADFSHKLLVQRSVEIRLNTRIKGATAQRALLADDETIPTRTLVAAIGAAPNRVLDTLPSERDRGGRLIVDETLSVPDYAGVWAIGDCAAVPDVGQGGTVPPTAQYALREAKHVARNILSVIEGKAPRPFAHTNLGVFVPLGRFSAAAEVLRFKVSGFPAWWLYRTYYLLHLPRFERRLRVVIDWTVELLFRRDIVQMDVSKSRGITRSHYQAGEVIFSQGELAGGFYVILDGSVQVYRQQDGKETDVASLGPGEFFGEMALLREGNRRTASVRAITAVDLLVMNEADFKALATSATQFSELLAVVMRQRRSADPSTGSGQAPSVGSGQEGSEKPRT